VAAVKEALKRNEEVLKNVSSRFTERLIWNDTVTKVSNLDHLLRHSIQIGVFLKFRNLLHQGLREVSEQQIPFIVDSIRGVFNQYPRNALMEPKLAPVDYLAQDIGLDVGNADHALKLALKKHKQSPADEALWSKLPELFAVSVTSPLWRDCQFLIQTESHSNNIHCLATTIVTLVNVFEAIPVGSIPPESSVDLRIKADLERFLRSACFSILHMSQHKGNDPFAGYPLPSIMVFIELFVHETGCLTLSILEDFFPFTLLRTNYIQMYEKQSIKGRSYAPVADDEKE